MPDTATVKGQGLCPACGTTVLVEVRCQWGIIPGAHYNIGDPVMWLRDGNGEIVQPFVLCEVGRGTWRWNSGEPRYHNVILFDALFTSDVLTKGYRCRNCGEKIAAGVAIVNRGLFQEIRALSNAGVDDILGKSRDKAEIVIIRDDGSYWVREDWYDHPLTLQHQHGKIGGASGSGVPEDRKAGRKPIE